MQHNKQKYKIARTSLVIYLLILLSISVSAHLGVLSSSFTGWDYEDKAMHFLLYGILWFLLEKSFKIRTIQLKIISFNKAILPASFACLIEELSQLPNPVRSFSITDLAWSLAGIATFYFIVLVINTLYNYGKRNEIIRNIHCQGPC